MDIIRAEDHGKSPGLLAEAEDDEGDEVESTKYGTRGAAIVVVGKRAPPGTVLPHK